MKLTHVKSLEYCLAGSKHSISVSSYSYLYSFAHALAPTQNTLLPLELPYSRPSLFLFLCKDIPTILAHISLIL